MRVGTLLVLPAQRLDLALVKAGLLTGSTLHSAPPRHNCARQLLSCTDFNMPGTNGRDFKILQSRVHNLNTHLEGITDRLRDLKFVIWIDRATPDSAVTV